MNVMVAPELEAMIREKVNSGQYSDASEVVEDALRQMEAREQRLKTLRAAIAAAQEQVARGDVREWTPSSREEIKRRAREAAKAGKQPKPDVCP